MPKRAKSYLGITTTLLVWVFDQLGVPYIVVIAVGGVALMFCGLAIWKFSSGIPYERVERSHVFSWYENLIRFLFVVLPLGLLVLAFLYYKSFSGSESRWPPKEISYVESYGVHGDTVRVVVDAEHLMKGKRDKYYLLLVCRWNDASKNAQRDTNIQLSSPFPIDEPKITMDVKMSSAFIASAVRPLEILLFIVPTSVPSSELPTMGRFSRAEVFSFPTRAYLSEAILSIRR